MEHRDHDTICCNLRAEIPLTLSNDLELEPRGHWNHAQRLGHYRIPTK